MQPSHNSLNLQGFSPMKYRQSKRYIYHNFGFRISDFGFQFRYSQSAIRKKVIHYRVVQRYIFRDAIYRQYE
jgi:hypothetical protein